MECTDVRNAFKCRVRGNETHCGVFLIDFRNLITDKTDGLARHYCNLSFFFIFSLCI